MWWVHVSSRMPKSHLQVYTAECGQWTLQAIFAGNLSDTRDNRAKEVIGNVHTGAYMYAMSAFRLNICGRI